MKTSILLRSASILALAVVALAARADLLIGNLPGNDNNSSTLGATAGKAMGFTTAAGAYTLTEATLRLTVGTGSLPTVQIWSSVANNPSAALATLTNPMFGAATASYSFTPSAPFVFAPSTTYWLVLSNGANATGNLTWLASSPNQTPTGIATHAGTRIGAVPPTTFSTVLSSYAITATPVPEPSALAALALGAIAVLRRRKRTEVEKAPRLG